MSAAKRNWHFKHKIYGRKDKKTITKKVNIGISLVGLKVYPLKDGFSNASVYGERGGWGWGSLYRVADFPKSVALLSECYVNQMLILLSYRVDCLVCEILIILTKMYSKICYHP